MKKGKRNGTQQGTRPLAALQVASKVTVRLPQQLLLNQLNLPLMSHYIRHKIANKKIKLNQPFIAFYLGKQHNFTIIDVQESPNDCEFIVNEETQVVLVNYISEAKECVKVKAKTRLYGLQKQFQNLKEAVSHSLLHRKELLCNGLGPLKGILIGGFSGTGKSALMRKLEEHLQTDSVHFKSISSVNLLSKLVGGAEEYIHNLFIELKEHQPCILAIEDIHLVFGKKEVDKHQTTLAALLSEMEGISQEEVIVIATFNSERDLSKSLRAHGKFEKEITLNLPNHMERLLILQGILGDIQDTCDPTSICLEDLKSLNLRLNGFSIGQIKQILREAYTITGKPITKQSIESVLKSFKPAEIRELIVEVPQVYWDQIGGYQVVKQQIKKVTELPLKHPEVFARFGIDPIKGIMLYGPPGCSKTMMAKAIATESKLNFIGIKGPELFSKYVGDSEMAVRSIFKRARACSPCIIFFDEIDALATQRSANTEVSDRVLCQLLNQMDGIEGLKEVVVVAATNRPEILDKALMRPGRFDYLIYISPPDFEARREIFKINSKKIMPPQQLHKWSEELAGETQNYTGAEISLVCRQATLLAIEENMDCSGVEMKHFEQALLKIRSRLTEEMVQRYERFQRTMKYVE